ncbi:hypothetical protein D3C79_901970 [compost metagenome]
MSACDSNARSTAGNAGRLRISTGTPSSRATSSFGSVATLPLFLLISTSILRRWNNARSSTIWNGPRAPITSQRSLPGHASSARSVQNCSGGISSRCCRGSRPSVNSGLRNGLSASISPAQSSTSRQSSPACACQAGRRKAQHVTPALRAALAALRLI